MNVSFACPACDRPTRLDASLPTDWQCPACEHRLRIEAADPALPHCIVCGNAEIYKKKDFPHWLGMTILVGACAVSVFTYGMYEPVWTWAILIGSALFDGLLYLWVGDALVCYRCHAHHRDFQAAATHQPFELTTGERYRQERMRLEHLRQKSEVRSQKSEVRSQKSEVRGQ